MHKVAHKVPHKVPQTAGGGGTCRSSTPTCWLAQSPTCNPNTPTCWVAKSPTNYKLEAPIMQWEGGGGEQDKGWGGGAKAMPLAPLRCQRRAWANTSWEGLTYGDYCCFVVCVVAFLATSHNFAQGFAQGSTQKSHKVCTRFCTRFRTRSCAVFRTKFRTSFRTRLCTRSPQGLHKVLHKMHTRFRTMIHVRFSPGFAQRFNEPRAALLVFAHGGGGGDLAGGCFSTCRGGEGHFEQSQHNEQRNANITFQKMQTKRRKLGSVMQWSGGAKFHPDTMLEPPACGRTRKEFPYIAERPPHPRVLSDACP